MLRTNRDEDYLEDMIEAIGRIIEYSRAYDFGAFITDQKTQDAVIRNIEIIGEAAKLLSPAVREAHPEIAWKEMIGTRDRLIHHYFRINLEIVWNIIQNDLPVLLLQIKSLRNP